MRKLLTALLICVYTVPTAAFVIIFALMTQEEYQPMGLELFVIPLILMVMVCAVVVANIVAAINSINRGKHLTFRAVMVSKLCLIPFYIVNFICWGIASMVFHLALIVLPLLPFIIAYTYFSMIGTSVYNVTKLITLRRNGSVSANQCILHCFLQFVFVLDVIDSVYLAVRYRGTEILPKQ